MRSDRIRPLRDCNLILLFMASVALAGCTTYHRVTDRASGQAYYTTNWNLHEYSNSSAVRLRDHTGQLRYLDDADVTEVIESEYRTGSQQQTEDDRGYPDANDSVEH